MDEGRFDTYLDQLGIKYPTLSRPASADDRQDNAGSSAGANRANRGL